MKIKMSRKTKYNIIRGILGACTGVIVGVAQYTAQKEMFENMLDENETSDSNVMTWCSDKRHKDKLLYTITKKGQDVLEKASEANESTKNN